MTAISRQQPAADEQDRCPFHRADSLSCRASVAGLRVEWRRRRSHCSTDDYEDCAIFLSRVLRASRPQATVDPWPIAHK